MDVGEIPLLAMLRSRLGYLSQRQQVIAQNVANADTPGYAPEDLKPFSFQARMQQVSMTGPSSMAVTAPGHMLPPRAGAAPTVVAKEIASKDSETTLDGNSVVLEEEMLKMSQARQDYDAAITFYQKALAMIRTAARAPGRG